MSDQVDANNEAVQPPREPKTFDKVFNYFGAFINGDEIAKESGMFFNEKVLQVVSSDIQNEFPAFLERVSKYQHSLPNQDSFPNGLSREQLARVLATFETIILYNGGSIDSHTEERNEHIYVRVANRDERIATLESFKGKQAMTCVEISVLAQQLLSSTEDTYYISGTADVTGSGSEGHTFQIIKAHGDPEYPYSLLDFSNPMEIADQKGATSLKLYCVPLTQNQFDSFITGQALTLNDRIYRYSYSLDPNDPFRGVWKRPDGTVV